MKTQRTKAPISRFPVITWLRIQSDSVVRVLILSAKSPRVVEWILNPWLAKIEYCLTA